MGRTKRSRGKAVESNDKRMVAVMNKKAIKFREKEAKHEEEMQ